MFTILGRFAAIALLVLGVLNIAMALSITSIDDPAEKATAIGSYLTKSTGKTIDQSLYYIFAAIVLGVLTDISTRLKKPKEE